MDETLGTSVEVFDLRIDQKSKTLEERILIMSTIASTGPEALAERVRKMKDSLLRLRANKAGISAKLLEKKLGIVTELLAETLPEGASDQAINMALLKYASENPGHYAVAIPPLKTLNPSQQLDFANSGEMPVKGFRGGSK